jgi:hypothetical protein
MNGEPMKRSFLLLTIALIASPAFAESKAFQCNFASLIRGEGDKLAGTGGSFNLGLGGEASVKDLNDQNRPWKITLQRSGEKMVLSVHSPLQEEPLTMAYASLDAVRMGMDVSMRHIGYDLVSLHCKQIEIPDDETEGKPANIGATQSTQ